MGCVDVWLGFGGRAGLVDERRLDAACAVNFGDLSPEPLPTDVTPNAGVLRDVLRLRADRHACEGVRRHALKYFAPGLSVQELARYLAAAPALQLARQHAQIHPAKDR